MGRPSWGCLPPHHMVGYQNSARGGQDAIRCLRRFCTAPSPTFCSFGVRSLPPSTWRCYRSRDLQTGAVTRVATHYGATLHQTRVGIRDFLLPPPLGHFIVANTGLHRDLVVRAGVLYGLADAGRQVDAARCMSSLLRTAVPISLSFASLYGR